MELEASFSNQTDKTKTGYRNLYKRLRPLLKDDVKNSSQEDIIDAIKAYDTSPATKYSLLTVAVVIFRHNNKDVDKFIKYRDLLNEQMYDKTIEKNKVLKSMNIKLKDLVEFMDKSYDDGDLTTYIINYLLINYQVRNKDLNLIITTDKKQLNDTDNFIYLKKASADYIRNDYKTVKTYEPIKIGNIRNKKFITALHTILGDSKTTPLLKSIDGRIATSSLNKFISKRTFQGLGEGKYFKIISSGKRNLKTMSEHRGTNPDTIVSSYILNTK